MTDVQAVIASMAECSMHDLRLEWRRHHRGDPPQALSRDLLLRSLAYRLQEQAQGGLSQGTKRALIRLGESGGRPDAQASVAKTELRPGVRLVREWRGEAHAVLVLQDGFEYRGGRYRSLTEIAKRITGAHWSGPRFFGLVNAPGNKPAALKRRVKTESETGTSHGRA